MDQLTSLLRVDRSALKIALSCPRPTEAPKNKTIAATGEFVQYTTDRGCADLPEIVSKRFAEVLAQRRPSILMMRMWFTPPGKNGGGNMLYLKHAAALGKMDRQLLKSTPKASPSRSTTSTCKTTCGNPKELVYTLADAVEARSQPGYQRAQSNGSH